MDRRLLLQAAALAPVFAAWAAENAEASPIDPKQTSVVQPEDVEFRTWGDSPPNSSEMAKLYGDIDRPGPYLVLMRWHPGWFSAPHRYVTDRVCVVVSGVWHVNSGADFDPANAVAVPAGGYVQREAHTYHYDGVPSSGNEPATIAVFGVGPVRLELADPGQPGQHQY